ncbi:MAG: hypothetical protein ABR887_00965 [Methanoregulaceae archaeon]
MALITEKQTIIQELGEDVLLIPVLANRALLLFHFSQVFTGEERHVKVHS